MKKQQITIYIIIIILLIGGFWYYHSSTSRTGELSESIEEQASKQQPGRVEVVPIEAGATYGSLMEEAGIDGTTSQHIYAAAHDVYDLADIRAGEEIELTFDPETDELQQLKYQTDTLHELFVVHRASDELVVENKEQPENQLKSATSTSDWIAQSRLIKYDIQVKTVTGTIDSSLYETGLDKGMDERAIIALAEVFQWSIDFAWGTRTGDTFTAIYEERYRNGEYIMPGRILAAKFVNDGREYQAYYFEASDEIKGYYDEQGNSTQKIFLKAPLEFKYISSGFTTNKRFVSSALGWTSSHQAIDYAADIGTPVRVVGDGIVVSAGWNTHGYGNLVTVSHNETYSTNYAHLSKIYVKRGEHVSQGDIIGAVGSTGFSSGPHLHFEMVKHGTKINPLTEELPSGEPIADEYQEQFKRTVEQYRDQLFQ